jgi:sigma-B regulation protein RsbU (phosphoserine phosphatase)
MPSFPEASLTVLAPSGQKTRAPIRPLPFIIGRQSDSDLVLRDNRASRKHARILFEGGAYVVEDLDSRHGVWINGQRVHRQVLREGDRIDLGLDDSYSLTFTREKDRFRKVLSHVSSFLRPDARTGDLAKLRSLVEVARALGNSLSTEEVLAAVVDAALTVTGCERGFLLLRGPNIGDLEIAVARDRAGRNLPQDALQVPIGQLWNLLATRRELLSMPFETSTSRSQPGHVLCLPLVRLRSDSAEETRATSTQEETAGVIYLDSGEAADLSSGSRELLETLAIEASTILENAYLLEEQRSKIRMEDELRIAREIQRGLQPVSFPTSGWFRALGSSRPSNEVGGDYYDVHSIPGIAGGTPDVWTIVMADVSGKGVSSALLASLLQGAFLMASGDASRIAPRMSQLNEFLLERTKGEKYVTVFYGVLDSSGLLSYTNAGQCAPVLVKADGTMTTWETTSMPVGMMEGTAFQMIQEQLEPGDRLVLFTDGVTEAVGAGGEFFGSQRLRQVIRENSARDAAGMHAAISDAVERFMISGPGEGARTETLRTDSSRAEDAAEEAARDDITLLVIEYAGRG